MIRSTIQALAVLGMAGLASLSPHAAGAGPAGKFRPSAVGAGASRMGKSGVRAMALINANGTIARSHGILAVTLVSAGHYCVTLKSSIDASGAVPVLSFNYASSEDYEVFIAYTPTLACPTNSVGVITYNIDNGFAFSNEGFTIVVP